jgi:hypothetical protein
MALIFVNRFFFPDHSATSKILSDLTFHLAAAGHEVHVITSTQIYDYPHAHCPDAKASGQRRCLKWAAGRAGRGFYAAESACAMERTAQ